MCPHVECTAAETGTGCVREVTQVCSREPVGRVHSIETAGMLDGPGIRQVIFLSGCPLRCQYCHNPDTARLANGVSTRADV